MVRKIFVALLILIAALPLWANGGPVDGSAILKMGELRFINRADIDLVKERLSFNIIEGDSIEVKVIYHLKNNSASDSGVIDYAFPLDYDYYTIYETGYEEGDEFLSGLCFKLNGKVLEYAGEEEETLYPINIASEYREVETETKRRWFTTQFSIEKEEEAVLEISYILRPYFLDFSTSKDYFVVHSGRHLYWDFSPAQYWGAGTVNDFEISIAINNPIIPKLLFAIEGLPFVKNHNVYTYHAKKFDLTTAEPLRIHYGIDTGSYYLDHSNLFDIKNAIGITASSSRQHYPLSNIKDKNYGTTWCPAGDGIGEWVELEIKKEHTILGAIVMFGGYTKSEETYYNNNRPKTVKLDTFGSYYGGEEYKTEEIIELEDITFDERLPVYLYKNLLYEFGEGMPGIKKIRITILDVYKGNKYNDSCISEIFPVGYIYNPDM